MVEKCLPSVENEIKRFISLIRRQSISMNEHRYLISINRITSSYVTIDIYPNDPFKNFGSYDLSLFVALNQVTQWIVIVTVEKGALCARCYPRNI